MAGIYERIKPTAIDRVGSHLIDSAYVFIHTGTFTNQQVLNAINSTVETPLTAAETTDLTNISTALSNAGSVTNKLVYLEKIKAAFICAEIGVINEATFRSALGIA
jgi:hypothetical protein